MPGSNNPQQSFNEPGLKKPDFGSLGNIPHIPESETQPDEPSRALLESLEDEKKLQEIEHRQDEHEQRIDFAYKIYWLSCIWLAVVIAVVVIAGLGCVPFASNNQCIPFNISDSVLITLLTTTTATVLGLFISVLNYLFYKKK